MDFARQKQFNGVRFLLFPPQNACIIPLALEISVSALPVYPHFQVMRLANCGCMVARMGSSVTFLSAQSLSMHDFLAHPGIMVSFEAEKEISCFIRFTGGDFRERNKLKPVEAIRSALLTSSDGRLIEIASFAFFCAFNSLHIFLPGV